LRRGGAVRALLVALIALVAVTTAAVFGTHVDGTRALPALTRSGGSNYARNAIGRLTPVDARFVRQRVGRIPGTRQTSTTTTPAPRGRPPAVTPSDNAIKGSPGALPGLAPGGWVLSLAMTPNSRTVHANDEIHYRIVVTNSGTEDFRGRAFLLEWHTPNGTLGRNALDQCSVLPIAIVRALCLSERLMFSPGLGDAHHENFNSNGLVTIPPGQSWTKDWFVQVLPSNAAGSTIFNHAHLTVTINGQDVRVRTPDVVVQVVA
jgi:hypothetical protein